MFWGLIMEPMRRYTQKVKKAFRITMASLDISTASNEPTQVMYIFENRNYLLCTLQKDKVMQCHLDLVFDVDDEVSFMVNGKNHVHLTGYLETDMDDDFGAGMLEEEEEEEETVQTSPKAKETENKKRKAKEIIKEPKKMKSVKDLLENTITDEDGSDDSDFNISNLMEEDSDDEVEEEEQDEVFEEDEDADDGIDSDSEQDEDDEEDEDEDESDEPEDNQKSPAKSKKPSMNGTASKEKIARLENNKKTPNKNEKQNEKVEKTPQKKQQMNEKKTPVKDSATPQKRTVEGGVIIEDLKVGNGQIAKPGRVVQVYYEGRFQKNNKIFDSSNKGPGFKFRLGKQEVIKGWDVGVSGMKVGGKRRITCPPQMAYGQKGSPPVIPPNSTLVFEVELKNVS